MLVLYACFICRVYLVFAFLFIQANSLNRGESDHGLLGARCIKSPSPQNLVLYVWLGYISVSYIRLYNYVVYESYIKGYMPSMVG